MLNKDGYNSLINDIVFKYIFGYSKNIMYTEYLLETYFNLEAGTLHNKVQILEDFSFDKDKWDKDAFRTDIKILINRDHYFGLKSYTDYNEECVYKSILLANDISPYIGEHLEKLGANVTYYQLLFINGDFESGTLGLFNKNKEPYIKDYFMIKVTNLNDYKDSSNDDKFVRLTKLMNAKSEEEENKIMENDEILSKIHKDKNEFLKSEFASNFFRE